MVLINKKNLYTKTPLLFFLCIYNLIMFIDITYNLDPICILRTHIISFQV